MNLIKGNARGALGLFLVGMSIHSPLLKASMIDKVAYGADGRIDVVDHPSTLFQELSLSVAIQINNKYLKENKMSYKLEAQPLADDMMICPQEKFASTPSPGNCSGFLVAPDVLVTAGHCVDATSKCSDYKWVFDFRRDEILGGEIPKESVYSCVQVLNQYYNTKDQTDYAVIKLDRKITDRAYLTFRTEGQVELGDPLVVIGGPSGVTLKIADGATVQKNDDPVFFVGDLDTFGGNSGSPVFNAQTGVVEGILVRGEKDYEYDNDEQCFKVKHCESVGDNKEEGQCRGEDVTRIGLVDLPKLLSEDFTPDENPFHNIEVDFDDYLDPIMNSLTEVGLGVTAPVTSNDDENAISLDEVND